jgi:hypothetical protein
MSVSFARIVREILILVACLALFPFAALLLLIYTDSLPLALAYVSREMLSGGIGPGGSSLTLLGELLAPYLMVQAVRSFLWSQRSLVGRKWGNLYFSILAASVAVWSFAQAWDLFYFMYRLGGIPGELTQFVELEFHNILIFFLCVIISIRCFIVFLNPVKGAPPRLKTAESEQPSE